MSVPRRYEWVNCDIEDLLPSGRQLKKLSTVANQNYKLSWLSQIVLQHLPPTQHHSLEIRGFPH